MLTYREHCAPTIERLLTGLWGDRAAIDATLAGLPQELAKEPLGFGYDPWVIERMGEIALARHDLPPADRWALVAGAMQVATDWMGLPLSHRASVYPFLDGIARDEALPAYLRSDALNRLDAEVWRCVQALFAGAGDAPPWGYSGRPEDAAFDAYYARRGHQVMIHRTIALVELPSLQASWRDRLIQTTNMAIHLQLTLPSGLDPTLDDTGLYLLLDVALPLPWLSPANRAAGQAQFDAFVARRLQVVRARWAVMDDDEARDHASLLLYDCVPAAARSELTALLAQRQAAQDAG